LRADLLCGRRPDPAGDGGETSAAVSDRARDRTRGMGVRSGGVFRRAVVLAATSWYLETPAAGPSDRAQFDAVGGGLLRHRIRVSDLLPASQLRFLDGVGDDFSVAVDTDTPGGLASCGVACLVSDAGGSERNAARCQRKK